MNLQTLQLITAAGGFLIFFGLIILVVNLVRSWRHGVYAGANPWNSKTLEWQVSSPPPEENFAQPPSVIDYPYGYGTEGAVHAIMKPQNTVEGNKDGQ
jgi:cytochrome c oxidase subunit 1